MRQAQAEFVERTNCINCGSANLASLSSGYFRDSPLRDFIENDPWGEPPLPYVKDAQWNYVKCDDCSQAFHKRILSPLWMDICYSEWVTQEAMQKFLASRNKPEDHFEKGRQHVEHLLRLENLTRDLRNGDAIRILDFGCGWGDFLATCACFGFYGSGIDFSPERRKEGRVSIFPSIDDLKSSSKAKLSFHVITLFEVLEHLASPLEILKSLYELLKPGGILVLETPNCTGIVDIKTATDYRHIHPLSHINGFTPETLSSIAKQAGFQFIDRGVAQVSCDRNKVMRTEVKRYVDKFRKTSTQQYFRKI